MKKIFFYCILLSCSPVNKTFAQSGNKGWTTTDRHDFIGECITGAKANMSEDSARSYCYCMQQKVEVKYPDPEKVGELTIEDMSTPEWQKEIKSCMTITSQWTANDRADYLNECIASAKENLGEQAAKNYCNCTLYKFEKKFPDPKAVAAITAEMMESPEFKKIINDCSVF